MLKEKSLNPCYFRIPYPKLIPMEVIRSGISADSNGMTLKTVSFGSIFQKVVSLKTDFFYERKIPEK